MPDIGVPELLIIAVIVLLLFGPGKAADIGSSLGKGIREFRKATRDDGAATSSASAADAAPVAAATASQSCTECGSPARDGQKFCENCGRPVP
ncbi:MAG: twin-arginine translocase TatA/TatE family subunit [Chloroflexi bacterium]|nr:twin-arginine translocase TatA/TatE family subunit [Chloroflexota bacterium]